MKFYLSLKNQKIIFQFYFVSDLNYKYINGHFYRLNLIDFEYYFLFIKSLI